MDLPKVMIFPLTYACNSRCTMCTIWQDKTRRGLSLERIDDLFSQPILAKNLEAVNITGGEATLRHDLIDIAEIIINRCQALQELSLNTNGFKSFTLYRMVKNILQIPKSKRLFIDIIISMDGVGVVHDTIRGVPGAFSRIEQSIALIHELEAQYPNLTLRINCTITKINYDKLEETWLYCQERDIPLDFTYAMITDIFVANVAEQFDISLNERQKQVVIPVLEKHMTSLKKTNTSRRYYRTLLSLLRGKQRKLPCILAKNGIFLQPDGKFFPCWATSEFYVGNIFDMDMEKLWQLRGGEAYLEKVFKKCLTCPNNCYGDWERRTFVRNLAQMRNIIPLNST